MTDWNAFCSTATSLTTAYSDSALKRCLVYIDPQVLDQISLKDRLLMRTGITSTKWGRDACFAKLFEHLLKTHPDVFAHAPPDAMRAYAALVEFLFSPEVARRLTATPSPSPAAPKASNGAMPFEKRLERFMQQASSFHDLIKKAEQVPSPEELTELEKTFDDRQASLDMLKVKRQKLSTLIQNLPKEPPAYLQPVQHPQEWQKLYTLVEPLYKPQTGEVKAFQDGVEFEEWKKKEEAFLQQVLEAAASLATAKTLEAHVHAFTESLKALAAYLYQTHIAPIGSLLEPKILAGQDEVELTALLQKQKQQCEHVEQFLAQDAERVREKSAACFQQLFSDKFMKFADLPEELKRIIGLKFEPQIICQVELTDEVAAQYTHQAKTFHDGLISQMTYLVDAATERLQRLEEMEQYSHIFFVLTAPAKQYKDLYSDYHKLEESMHNLTLMRQQCSAGSFAENEKALKTRYEGYLELKINMPQAINALILKAQQSQQRAEDDKSAIKRRLFEIFWNISPYLDLMESFQDMRSMLTSKLQDGVRAFYSGTLSHHELLGICQEMPYEHDVVKLRNEITHRSARLKDLRDEGLRLLVEVQQIKRFLEIADLKAQKTYHDLLSEQATILAILAAVENPFSAFAKAETKDDINYVFRNFWIRIEEVQPLVEQTLAAANLLLKKAAPVIKATYLKALDTLEDVLSQKAGSQVQLVTKAESDLQFASQDDLFSLLVSSIHALEKSYSFSMPFAFFMLVPEHKTRLSMLQEAAVLDARIKETVDFAKAMQYVKTFEEERVDIILEAFERQHIVVEQDCTVDDLKTAWTHYRERMHRASCLVEDEIFLDIGLLDRHALMDVDQKELSKTLRLAISRASHHIFEPKYGMLANLQGCAKDEPLCKKTHDTLKGALENWSKVPVTDDMSVDELLEHLRNYCHSLFDAKVIIASSAKMLLPSCLGFMNELRCFVSHLESSLQDMRIEHVSQWGKQWISECHSMRCELECFEPEEETAEAFKPIMKKISATVDQIPERSRLQLDAIQKELDGHLLEIEELAKDPKKDHPFIYIPGYLDFFNFGTGAAHGQ